MQKKIGCFLFSSSIKTKVIVALVILHLIVVAINWTVLVQMRSDISDDTKIVNMIGQIRGSIQRASKLALANEPFKQSKQLIENNFRLLNSEYRSFFDQKSLEALSLLQNYWIELKIPLEQCAHSSSEHHNLIQLSEKLWTQADITAKTFERNAEAKLKRFRIVFIIFFCEVIIVILIIAGIFRITQNTIQKERVIMQQARLAAMGEMVANIAHQWRQPLNALSLLFTKLELAFMQGKLDEQMMEKSARKSELLFQQMSQTIDDFKNFFKPTKEKTAFTLQENIEHTLTLISAALEENNIKLHLDIPNEPIKLYGYPNEFSHVVLNILNNAKDAIVSNSASEGVIRVAVEESQSSYFTLLISDNGGGIPTKFIKRIFEPYFTTKHQTLGTGIGLYMSKQIIEENMDGTLSAVNIEKGACFSISLPLQKNQ